MKPCVRGKSIFFREVSVDDAKFILDLRTNPDKNKFLSTTENDLEKQKAYIHSYLKSDTEYYFIICNWKCNTLGTVRIYDVREDSFCWGSWIISKDAPTSVAIESALLVYDFAFYSLHYSKSHFDVRKNNAKVINFHERFGATIVGEDELNYFFEYTREKYLEVRQKYTRYLP